MRRERLASMLLLLELMHPTLKCLIILASLCISFKAIAAIISPSGQEHDMRFTATLRMPLSEGTSESSIEKGIKNQTRYLVGVFRRPQFSLMIGEKPQTIIDSDKPVDETGAIAAGPIRNYTILSQGFRDGFFEVTYSATMQVLTLKSFSDVNSDGSPRKIQLIFPYDPFSAFSLNCVPPELSDPTAFFYDWNIFKSACSKFEESRHNLERVDAELQPVSQLSADLKPDYEKLLEQAKSHNSEIRIATLLGYYEPTTIDDDSRNNFNAIYRELTENQNFSLVANLANLNSKASPKQDKQPYVELYRAATVSTPAIRLWLSLSFTRGPQPKAFAERARFAIESADVMTYWGHSGLGRFLNFDWIAQHDGAGPIKFSDNYQLFFLQGCDSFIHYSVPYREHGNSAVVTAGFSLFFGERYPEVLEILKSFYDPHLWGQRTWLEMLTDIESREIKQGSRSLINVSGI